MQAQSVPGEVLGLGPTGQRRCHLSAVYAKARSRAQAQAPGKNPSTCCVRASPHGPPRLMRRGRANSRIVGDTAGPSTMSAFLSNVRSPMLKASCPWRRCSPKLPNRLHGHRTEATNANHALGLSTAHPGDEGAIRRSLACCIWLRSSTGKASTWGLLQVWQASWAQPVVIVS